MLTTETPGQSPATVPASDPNAAARKQKATTVLAESMTIEGGIIGDGELHVDGVVRGDIKVAKLTIGESGCVEGSIMAEAVENRGRIIGTVTAKQVRLYASAYVDGDITHEQLAMEIGAFFQGRSLKFQRPAGSSSTSTTTTTVTSQPSALPKPDPEPKAIA